VKRECYTLCGFEGQTEEALRVRGSHASQLEGIVAASCRELRERVSHPCRLVPLPPEGDGGQIGGVGLHQQSVLWYEAEQIVVAPLVEGHNAAERHVPAGSKRELRQCMRPGVAVQNTDDAGASSFPKKLSRVVFCIPGVDHNRSALLGGESYLSGKRRSLRLPWRIIVVIVEPALSDCYSGAKELTEPGDIALLFESRRIMGMDARRREDKTRILGRALSCDRRYPERLSDADDGRRARIAGAGDYRAAVAGERRVREVGVAVDED
jgi:hypothetical protein